MSVRVEATIPESRGAQIDELVESMGLTRSQVIDEALALFLKAVLEFKRGRRLVMIDPTDKQPTCELTTPTLSALEWTLEPDTVELSEGARSRMRELAKAPAKPGSRLKAAAKRHRR